MGYQLNPLLLSLFCFCLITADWLIQDAPLPAVSFYRPHSSCSFVGQFGGKMLSAQCQWAACFSNMPFPSQKDAFRENGCFIFKNIKYDLLSKRCFFGNPSCSLSSFGGNFCGQDAVFNEIKWIYTEFADHWKWQIWSISK